jgi:hypothetical protein
MSERSEFSHEHDELASAYLDNEVTTEERARVEADPALVARVEELRSVHDALSDPVVPPTTTERDAAVTAALGAANVIDISAARGRRRLRIASIAAAVLLVLGAAGALIRAADNGSTQKLNAVAASIGSAGDSKAAERATGAAAGAGTAGAFSTTGRPMLGAFTDRSALAAAAQAQVHSPALNQSKPADTETPSAAAASPTTTAPTCLVPAPPDATNEVYAATAVLDGHPVQVDVFTKADESLVLVVTDAASCAQVFTQPV